MDPCTGLQTADAAITLVALAIRTFKFFRNVVKAVPEAQNLAKRLESISKLVSLVSNHIEARVEVRPAEIQSSSDRLILEAVQRSARACYRSLVDLNCKVRGLTPDGKLKITLKVQEGFRWVLTAHDRRLLEANLETTVRDLQIALALLDQLSHGDTQHLVKKLDDKVNEALEYVRTMTNETNQHDSGASPVESHGENLSCLDSARRTQYHVGLQSLQATIKAAKSVSASRSTASQDDESTVQRQELLELRQEEDDSPGSDWLRYNDFGIVMEVQEDRTDAMAQDEVTVESKSQLGQVSVGMDTEDLLGFKASCQKTAGEESRHRNYAQVEENLQRAITYGLQLEQRGIEFNDHTQILRQLVEIYELQGRYGQAASEMVKLTPKLPTDTSTVEQVRYVADFWTTFARLRYAMFKSAKADDNVGMAEGNIVSASEYCLERAFPRLKLLSQRNLMDRKDPLWIECVQLAIDILEDNNKAPEAKFMRQAYLTEAGRSSGDFDLVNSRRTAGLSPRSDEPPGVGRQKQVLIDFDALISFPGKPKLANAVVFNLVDRFQTVLDETTDAGGDVDERCSERGWTALMYAIECEHPWSDASTACGCTKAIEKLLLAGADINATTVVTTRNRGSNSRYSEGTAPQTGTEETALHQACRRGDEAMVQLLIRKDADKNACAPITPLIVAIKADASTIVNTLLEHGADPTVIDDNGWTILHHAIMNCAKHSVAAILKPKHTIRINRTMSISSSGSSISQADDDPLFHSINAIAQDRTSVLLSTTCMAGKTPLHHVSAKASVSGSKWYEMATLLLKAGSDPNARDEVGRTPLRYATESRVPQESSLCFISLLLEYGADPTLTPVEHRTNFGKYKLLGSGSKPSTALLSPTARRDSSSTLGSRRTESLRSFDSLNVNSVLGRVDTGSTSQSSPRAPIPANVGRRRESCNSAGKSRAANRDEEIVASKGHSKWGSYLRRVVSER